MSEYHAVKIRHWLISMMIIALATITSFSAASRFSCGIEDYLCFIALGRSLTTPIVLFPLIAAWHLFDFMHAPSPTSRLARSLTGFPSLLAATVVLGALLTLVATDRFTSIQPCGSSFRILSQSCTVPSPLLDIPISIAVLLLIVLIASKAVLAFRSSFRKKT